jgi:hypothetical protein
MIRPLVIVRAFILVVMTLGDEDARLACQPQEHMEDIITGMATADSEAWPWRYRRIEKQPFAGSRGLKD